MFEGISTYLGYLSLHAKYPEGRQFADLLRFGREKLLDKNSEGQTLESAGPIWLGRPPDFLEVSHRLLNAGLRKRARGFCTCCAICFRIPSQALTDRFKILLRDFVSSYAGGLVETADFQKIVNKHMSARVGSGGQPEARLVFRPVGL
jgi:hypothetical protein